MLKPLGDKVVVERVKAESKTPGGIVLPDAAKEKPQRGIVRAVGPGKMMDNGKRCEIQVSVGNEVIFTAYAGTEVQLDRTKFMIMNESDILAILK
ncbi:MAG: co-chaperone GroES [Promethearchaeota archaeon]